MEWTYLFMYPAICFFAILLLILLSDGDLTLMFVERFGKTNFPSQIESKCKGKVFWIVGASTGIGEHLAYELISNGAKVVLSARREEELRKVKNQCLVVGKKIGATEADILLLPLDVTNYESHEGSFKKIIEHFGTVDVLINNAGRSQRAQWDKIDIRVDKDLFDVNLFGIVNLTRVVLPHFLEKGKGHIAVTSSVCGKVGAPCSASYNGTKHALHGYFEGLRAEMSYRGISVTMLCPGPVFSDLLSACATETYGQKLGGAMTPKDRRMKTDRCAHLCTVAIANELDEAWMAQNPVLLFLYFSQYAPSVFRWISARMGSRVAMNLRDSRNDLVKTSGSNTAGDTDKKSM